MNRTWWQHLQTIAPQALSACTTRFAAKYPRDWRRRIQLAPELIAYFLEMHKLELQLARTGSGAQPFGYRIAGRSWRVNRSRSYATAEEAQWAALSVAFVLVEVDARRVPFVRPTVHQPVRRQPKAEKASIPQDGWRKDGM